MARRKVSRKMLVAIIIVLAAVLVYTLLPYVVSTKVSNLHNNENTYVYGTVENRKASGNTGAFEINDGSGNLWVVWNGTLPTDGQKVLVHGTYQKSTLLVFTFADFKAASVTDWPV